jgi:seryl-tRNA synthetase
VTPEPGVTAPTELLTDLFDQGLLVETGVVGLYGRSGTFEAIRLALEALIERRAAGDLMRVLRFPPLLPRRHLETAGYLTSFPHLAGTVFAFAGDEAQARAQDERAARHEEWSEFQSMTDLVLTPAACYPVYPALAAAGPLPAGGAIIDAGGSYVFRREPSKEPTRLQMFHQREFVRAGEAAAVLAWRDTWQERAAALLAELGLEFAITVAADPFFGRGGRMLEATQRELALKFEAQVRLANGFEPVAVASFNYHQDHFGTAFGIMLEGGGYAHTACVGHGEERIVVALLSAHGPDPDAWPEQVRNALWPATGGAGESPS